MNKITDYYAFPSNKRPKIIISEDKNIRKQSIQFLNNSRYSNLIKNYLSSNILFNLISKKNKYENIEEIYEIRAILNDIKMNNKIDLIDKFNIYNGGSGLYRKITVQVFGKSNNLIGYMKISRSIKSVESICQEYKILNYLNNKLNKANILRTPKVIDFNSSKESAYIFQSNIESSIRLDKFENRRKVIDCLLDIFNISNSEHNINLMNTSVINTINNDIKFILNNYNKDKSNIKLSEIMNKIIDYTANLDSNINIKECLNHNDFTMWNLEIYNENVYVFDWEWGDINGLPLIDLCHYINMPLILSNEDFKDIIKQDKVFSEDNLIDICRYSDITNIKVENITEFIKIYYIKTIIFYLKSALIENKEFNNDRVINYCMYMLRYLDINEIKIQKKLLQYWRR